LDRGTSNGSDEILRMSWLFREVVARASVTVRLV
jgi:hypothetical protein